MKVIKRDGTEVVFDISKIIAAVEKANNADETSMELTSDQIRQIASNVEQSCLALHLSLIHI